MLSCGVESLENKKELTNTLSQKKSLAKNLPNGIQINIDTLDLSINGWLREVVLFKNKFYCMFETNRENTSRSFKKMIVFDTKGNFMENVFVPEGIQNMNYYKIVTENDSLFLKRTQFDEETFVLGKYVTDFEQIKRRNFSVFQDDFYRIYQTCNGEWGGTIFFENKKTKEIYEASSTCPIVVNKIDNDYYVTNYMGHMIGFASVLKISDPTKLHKSQLNFDTREGSKYKQGVKTLLDTMDFYIPTSFVIGKELNHLYSDKNGTYIGRIEDGQIIPIYKFDFKFYANFNQTDSERRQILGFNIPKSDYKGVLVINNNELNFYYIK